MKVIEIEKLVVAYDEDKPVLDDFNLGIEKGKMTAFVGPNGAGKSTLIKAILEFVKPKLLLNIPLKVQQVLLLLSI